MENKLEPIELTFEEEANEYDLMEKEYEHTTKIRKT